MTTQKIPLGLDEKIFIVVTIVWLIAGAYFFAIYKPEIERKAQENTTYLGDLGAVVQLYNGTVTSVDGQFVPVTVDVNNLPMPFKSHLEGGPDYL